MTRAKTLLDEADKINCKAVVAFEPENVFYLTGFWGEATAVVDSGGTKLIAPNLEVSRARKSSKGCEVIATERGTGMVKTLLSNLDQVSTCTDCSDLNTFEQIRKKIRRLEYSTEPFYSCRKIKDANECKIIKDAAKVLDKLFAVCEREIKTGLTEKKIQAMLMYEGMKRGAYPPSHRYTISPLIVASGSNSSLPHAEPTDRRVKKGDFVTVDLTLRYRGYIADATRTFAVGIADAKMKEVYGIVKEAQEAGLDAVKEGASCDSIDSVCRSVIERSGYGNYFVHSTGHGIGLEVHEPPWIRMNNEELLPKNSAITVEPGIYLPNKLGVRIEDSVFVNKKGEVLNKFTKDLIVL